MTRGTQLSFTSANGEVLVGEYCCKLRRGVYLVQLASGQRVRVDVSAVRSVQGF
jgi:hypothetical protein